MSDPLESGDLATIRRERDFYLRLLKLGRQSELSPLLSEALALIVELSGANQGYLEIHDHEEHIDPRRWWIAHGFSAVEVEAVRAAISHGIIAEALATGQTIVTPSALLDPRFSERRSAQGAQIESVLCT